MNNFITYSVLQYKHSLVLGEVLNVGVLFYFHDENKFEFVSGNSQRLKAVYPGFDVALFNTYHRVIEEKIKGSVDLFYSSESHQDISTYIHRHILAKDAAGLVFDTPKQVKNVWDDHKTAVEEYSKILLPGIHTVRPVIVRHNESFILKRYTHYILDRHKELEEKIVRNQQVKTKHLSLKFEVAWKKGTRNLVKPLSFDLTDVQGIQTKAATYLGYLTTLEDYAKKHNTRFDFLIARPQNVDLKSEYENALDLLDWAKKTPKKLVTEDKWAKYSEETVEALLQA